MEELTLSDLVSAMNSAGADLERKVLASCMSAIRVMSVSGARQGLSDGTDIHGKPFAPLKHARPEGAGKPLQDKGLLAASLSASVTESEVTLSANSPGAGLQNYGGTVYPTKAKRLAIPVTVEAKRVGSPGGRFPRPLFVLSTKSATTGLLAENVGGKIVVHYVLVKSVTVPARQYLGWSAQTLARIGQLTSHKYAEALAELFKKGK